MPPRFRFHTRPFFDPESTPGSTPATPAAAAAVPATSAQSEPTPATPEQSVPYARFKEVNDKLKALETAAKNRETADKTVADQIKALQDDAATTKRDNARLKVIAEKQVPEKLQKFLTGTDEASFAASADELLAALVEVKTPAAPGVPPASKRSTPTTLDINTMTPEEIRKNKGKLWPGATS